MIEAPEPPHGPHATSRWFDMAIAIAIVLVSSASLYVSLHTGSTMERLVEQDLRLVRANSVPLLQFGTRNATDDRSPEFSFEVANVGTGPARIIWFEIRQNDGSIGRNYGGLFPNRATLSPIDVAILISPIAPSMMPAGEQRRLLQWLDRPPDLQPGPLGTSQQVTVRPAPGSLLLLRVRRMLAH